MKLVGLRIGCFLFALPLSNKGFSPPTLFLLVSNVIIIFYIINSLNVFLGKTTHSTTGFLINFERAFSTLPFKN